MHPFLVYSAQCFNSDIKVRGCILLWNTVGEGWKGFFESKFFCRITESNKFYKFFQLEISFLFNQYCDLPLKFDSYLI